MNNEKLKKKTVDIIAITTIFVAAVFIILIKGGFPFDELFSANPEVNQNYDYGNTNNDYTNQQASEPKQAQRRVSRNIDESGGIIIDVNQPVPLSYLSKDMVYTIRKNFVKTSVFAEMNYEPSAEALGMIEDRKPWMSVNRCNGNKPHANIDGDSEESKDLNNPSLLISIDWPVIGNFTGEQEHLCTEALLPEKILYYPDKKQIDVYYKHLFTPPSFSFILKGLNARDFGYKFAYLDDSMSENPLKFINENNISTNVVELLDFIHTGGSCKVEGGCNNGSPYQPYLQFKYTEDDIHSSHIMYFKIWKNRPDSVDAEPDIIERIIIDKQ